MLLCTGQCLFQVMRSLDYSALLGSVRGPRAWMNVDCDAGCGFGFIVICICKPYRKQYHNPLALQFNLNVNHASLPKQTKVTCEPVLNPIRTYTSLTYTITMEGWLPLRTPCTISSTLGVHSLTRHVVVRGSLGLINNPLYGGELQCVCDQPTYP